MSVAIEEVKSAYTVEVDIITKHSFHVDDMNSPEEAEDVVRQWIEEGEQGDLESKEVFSMDSYRVATQEDDN